MNNGNRTVTDFIADNFGLLELLLFLELVVLATAAAFYQIAKLASGRSRHDPMVRFYHVFWRGFFADVTPVGVLRAQQAETLARRAGLITVGDLDPEQLARMDAPDLNEIANAAVGGRPINSPTRLPAEPPAVSPPRGNPPAPATPPVGDATLEVRIVGRSKIDTVAGHDGRTLIVHVRCEVEDGQANGVVVELASQALQIPVYRIVLLRGHYKSDKAFKLLNFDQATLDRRVSAM